MFKLLSTTDFPERRLVAKRFRHSCGMEVLSLEADDAENLFALCFRTVPEDSTGVPHIIEHSVLEGSQKYPVKDPFVCMLKTSVATFINAMTYPDRTVYPCATCCKKDYFNLFEVYWDAVFHPRLNRETFAQEGWHYEIEGDDEHAVLKTNGIVLNEMSGYYSDPMTLLGRTVEETLFPEAPVRHDSGGAPDCIPHLTYAKFLRYYREHYNPAVTRVVLYGDIPTEDKLAFIEARLQEDFGGRGAGRRRRAAGRRKTLSATSLKFKPRVVQRQFMPVEEEEEETTKAICALAWRLDCTRDSELDLGFRMLEAVLLGNAAAPLRLALMQSRLGTALIPSGFDNETRFTSFQVGLRDVAPEDFPKVEALVTKVLQDLVVKGLPAELVETAVTAFQLANQNIGGLYPVDLLEDVVASWNDLDDPFLFLRQSEALPHLQEMLAEHPRYLEELIQKWLLDNPARVRIDLLPEPNLRERQERAVALRLRRKLARWTPEHVRQTREFAQLLQDKAVTPDSPEALQTLPLLTRQDLPSKVKPLPLVRGSFANGLRWQRGEVFHNGISRARFLGDASGIPVEQTLHAGRLMALLPLLGNATQSYEAAAAERARLGVSYTLAFTESSRPDSPDPYRLMEISFSGLDRNYAAGLEILRRQLDTVVFTERKRLVEILRQGAAKATAALATRKNLVNCKSRAGVGIAPSGSLVEAINGFTGYLELQRLGKLTEGELDDFCEALRQCAATIRTLPLFACGFVGADECLAATEKFTDSFSIVARPQLFVPPKGIGPQLEPAVGRHEFCAINTQVSTCARVFAAPHRTEEGSMALKVLTGFLSVGYLWDEIRAKGGAYGTGFAYNDLDCIACLSSTEDPKARNTYRVFDALPDYLRKHTFTEREVGQAVLSAAGGFLRPDRPAELCIMAANHLWHDRTEEERQREFETLLAITPREVKEVANRFFDPQSARYNDCAAGPASAAIAGFTPISLKG